MDVKSVRLDEVIRRRTMQPDPQTARARRTALWQMDDEVPRKNLNPEPILAVPGTRRAASRVQPTDAIAAEVQRR